MRRGMQLTPSDDILSLVLILVGSFGLAKHSTSLLFDSAGIALLHSRTLEMSLFGSPFFVFPFPF